MELIDWAWVLTVVVAGVVIVSGMWALVLIGAVCFGYRRRSLPGKAVVVETPPRHLRGGSSAGPGEKVLDFKGVCVAADASFPVSGAIRHFAPGEVGDFSYSLLDAPTISRGRATLTIAGGESWSISVLATGTTCAGRGQSTFRVEGIVPLRTAVLPPFRSLPCGMGTPAPIQ